MNNQTDDRFEQACEKLAKACDETAAAMGRLSCLFAWLIESGELIPDEPEFELSEYDYALLTAMKIAT